MAMRVLVVSHTYISPINRKKWQVLASIFSKTNITVVFPQTWPTTIFNHIAESDLSKFALSNCKFVALKAFKTGNEVLYHFDSLPLLRLIKDFKPDIVHVEQGDNSLSYFQTILFSKMLRLKSKFVFFTWVNWQHRFSLKYRIFWTRIENFNLKKSDAAVVGNNAAQEILLKKGFEKPILVLPQLGIDTQTFQPAKKCNQTIKIGFAGRLVKEKGIFLLLDAFIALSNKYSNLKMSYLGSGPCLQELTSQIKNNNVSDKVEILQPVPHEQVANFMHSLDIFVLPSFDTCNWREQFGHVLIEAMACNVAVVGSDAGAIPEVLADAGLVFKQNDVLSLQNTMDLLINNKSQRLEIASRGYKRALKVYSLEAVAKQTYEFWKSIL